MIKKLILILVFYVPFIVYADDYKQIESESIDVITTNEEKHGSKILREDIERTNAGNLWEAMGYTTGVMLQDDGARGEQSFNIRGMDSVYIPVVIDGVPVNNFFNGKSNASSILSGDLESIVIQKGYSSLVSGVNGLGGAVFLTTSKPKKKFELYFKDSVEMDSRFKFASTNMTASVGSKLEKVYFKASFDYKGIDHFKLSNDYKQISGSIQKKGNRLFSGGNTLKGSFIAGYTPLKELDIWLKYVYQKWDKGLIPPETSSSYSLRKWNDWDYNSISIHGKYDKDKINTEFTVFYNMYDNSLSEFASITHVEYNRPYNTTVYDEYSTGLNFNAGYDFTDEHNLKGAFSFRQDDHKGYRNNKDDIHVRENKITLGLEYEYKPLKNLTFAIGGGFDSLIPDKYWSKNDTFAGIVGVSSYNIHPKDQWLLSAQIGIFYDFVENNQLFLTYARRNQFPTMNDRYSTRFGEMLPNPNLKPETANHVEFGYKGVLFNMLGITSSLYYSYIQDKMVVIGVPDPFNPNISVDFNTNLDEVSTYGFELSATLFVYEYLEVGANLSVNEYYINKSQANIKTLTYYPEIVFNSYFKVMPCSYFYIMPVVEYVDKRYTDLDGINSLDGYVLTHLYTKFIISDNFSIDINIKNIGDVNYSLRKYYPMAGRTYSFALTAEF